MRNQSLAAMVKPCISCLVVVAGLVVVVNAAFADPVYKWRDSSGHSHYSQTPPEGQKYETITPAGHSSSDASDAKPAGAEVPATGDAAKSLTPAQVTRQKLCVAARANMSTLTSHATVTSDINGDGKQVTLNAAQHDAALSDAKKQVDLYCTN